MARVFSQYEQRKSGAGLIDFEDLLESCVRMYEEDEWAWRRCASGFARSPSTSTRT